MLSSLTSMADLLTVARILRPAMALIVMCVTAVTASAAPQDDDIHARVKQGQNVSVTDAQGREFKGRILDVSSDSVAIQTGRSRSDVRRSEILRIDHLDGLGNGALIGVLVGAGLFAVDVVVSREDGLYLNPAGYVVSGAIYCGLGARAGGGLDAPKSRNPRPASRSPLPNSDRAPVTVVSSCRRDRLLRPSTPGSARCARSK